MSTQHRSVLGIASPANVSNPVTPQADTALPDPENGIPAVAYGNQANDGAPLDVLAPVQPFTNPVDATHLSAADFATADDLASRGAASRINLTDGSTIPPGPRR